MQDSKVDIRDTGKDELEMRPPLFKRWRSWYAAILLVLVLLILFFYLFTKHFA